MSHDVRIIGVLKTRKISQLIARGGRCPMPRLRNWCVNGLTYIDSSWGVWGGVSASSKGVNAPHHASFPHCAVVDRAVAAGIWWNSNPPVIIILTWSGKYG